MQADILVNGSPDAVRSYVSKKMVDWKHWTVLTQTRQKRCARYYAVASDGNKRVIKAVYAEHFKDPFPQALADKFEAAAVAKGRKGYRLNRAEVIDRMEKRRAELAAAADTLKRWKDGQDYQEGEGFFQRLKAFVEPLLELDGALEPKSLSTLVTARYGSELNHSGSVSATGVDGSFDYMLGADAVATVTFVFDQAGVKNTTTVQGTARGGLWAKGNVSASAATGELDFSAALSAKLGGELKVTAKSTWSVDKVEATLAGKGKVFVGGRAKGEATVKASAKGSFEAALSAEAFVGVEASVSGTATLTYDGKDLATASASANFSFGAGGSFSASISAGLFGPTTIDFSCNAALGIGGGTDTSVSIDFKECGLAAGTKLRELVHRIEVNKGYSLELDNQTRKNVLYLNLSIAAVDDAQKELAAKLRTQASIPEERQALLMDEDF